MSEVHQSFLRSEKGEEGHQISIPIAAFSVISVTIGAGMVSVPKAAYNSGIIWSLGYNVFNLIACVYSIHLFLRCAQVTGRYSMPELGYICFGRFSLYMINFLQIIAFVLTPVAYFIIFSNLLRSFFNEISWVEKNSQNVIGSQWLSVLILAVLVIYYILKKKIEELKIAGILLFTGVSMFIVLLFVLKIFNGSDLEEVDTSFEELWLTNFDMNFISSLSTAFVAYGFQSAFFPIYNSLQNKSYANGMKFTIFGMGFCFFIYTCVTFVSLYSFGSDIEGDVLVNVERITVWESYTLRVIFLVVLATHTPFVLFIGKESVLAIVALLYLRGDRNKDLKKSTIIMEDPIDHGRTVSHESHHLLPEDNELNASPPQRTGSIQKVVDTEEVVDQAVMCTANNKMSVRGRSIGSRKSFVLKQNEMEKEISGATELLPNWLYYTVTLITYAAVVTAACTIKDVEIVIKFVGSLANALLNFTLPGLFYFIIMRKYNAGKQWWKLAFALSLAIYGTVMGLFLTGVNIWTTISPIKD